MTKFRATRMVDADADSGGEKRFGGALEESLSRQVGPWISAVQVVAECRRPGSFWSSFFIPFVKLESRNTCRRTTKRVVAKK